MRYLATFLLVLLVLIGCGDKKSGSSGVPEVEPCSGHGVYELASNMQSFCICDPGYREVIWTRWDLNENGIPQSTGLCLPEWSRSGHGLAHTDGTAPNAAQIEAMLTHGLNWTVVDLPVAGTAGLDEMNVVGRIRFDEPNLSKAAALQKVDELMATSPPRNIVIQDKVVYDADWEDAPGCSNASCFMDWFEHTHMPVICAAIDRVRQWCPACQVGLSGSYGGTNQVYTMGNKLLMSNQLAQCSINFVEQVFADINPVTADPEDQGNMAWTMKQNETTFRNLYFIARIESFKKSPFDLKTPEESAKLILEAAIRLRASGFNVVFLPNLAGENLPFGTEALSETGELKTTGVFLKTLESLVGDGELEAVEPEGLYAVKTSGISLEETRYLALSPEALTPPEKENWGESSILDFSGKVALRPSPFVPMEEQRTVLDPAAAPFYVVWEPLVTYSPAAFYETEAIFQDALLLEDWLYPSGEEQVNLDQDPELEWWGDSGYFDEMEPGVFRRVVAGITDSDLRPTFYDINLDGLLDIIHAQTIQYQNTGGDSYVIINHMGNLNNDYWMEGANAFNLADWPLKEMRPQGLPKDFTGDGLPDPVGRRGDGIVIYESTAEMLEFVEHEVPGIVSGTNENWRIVDVDNDGLWDIIPLLVDLGYARIHLDNLEWIWLNREDSLVVLETPCNPALGTITELGLEETLGGPGILCVDDAGDGLSVSPWLVQGDAFVQAWEDKLPYLEEMGVDGAILPYRSADGAPTQILATGIAGMVLGEVTADGVNPVGEWKTKELLVSDYYAAGPTGKTWLLAKGLRVGSPEEALLLAPAVPDWAADFYPGLQYLPGDLDGNGKEDLVKMGSADWEIIVVDEVGKPYASWQEQKLSFSVLYDYLDNPSATWQPLVDNLMYRAQNGCQNTLETFEGGPKVWDYWFAVGEFDGVPGDDVYAYSIVKHSLKDVWPTGYVISGKTGAVSEFDGLGLMEARVITNSDCGKAAVMAADLDEDGIDDILMWDSYQETLHMLCTDGGGGLDKSRRYETFGIGSEPRVIKTVDVNFDGHTDIVLARLSDITFYLGNGQCEFNGKREYSVGINTQWHNDFACDDFDGDGATFECFFKCLWSIIDDGQAEYCLATLPQMGGLISEDQWTPVLPPVPAVGADAQPGDFNGDGVTEVLTNGSVLRVVDGEVQYVGTYSPTPVRVVGDINGNGADDVLTDSWTVLYGKKK